MLLKDRRGQDSGKAEQGPTAVTAAPAMCSQTHHRKGVLLACGLAPIPLGLEGLNMSMLQKVPGLRLHPDS